MSSTKHIIKTQDAPLPIGPYNQAVMMSLGASGGKVIYTSGQIPVDPKTNVVSLGGVKEQTRMVLENVKKVLAGAGASMDKVVKATVFLKNMGDFAAMNEVYAEYFNEASAPARSTVEVARLPKDVLVEIEVVAFL